MASCRASLLYQGPVTSFKVVRLKENSNYAFRIRASNLNSEGDWSPLVSFSTCFAPPAAPPAPRVEKVPGEGESFIVDWSAATSLWKFAEPCQFVLELGEHQHPTGAHDTALTGAGDTQTTGYSANERQLNWSEIYCGSEERTRISVAPTSSAEDLRYVRLAQLRLIDIDTNIKSPYCQPVPLVGKAARSKALSKTVRPQAVAEVASVVGVSHAQHHAVQPQQPRRNR